jgi:hypothetical protein
VAIPQQLYMTRPAYLGLHHGAFVVGDPSGKGYKPPTLQLAVPENEIYRTSLLPGFELALAPLLAAADRFSEEARTVLPLSQFATQTIP